MHSDAAHECDHDEENYNYVNKSHGDNDYHEALSCCVPRNTHGGRLLLSTHVEKLEVSTHVTMGATAFPLLPKEAVAAAGLLDVAAASFRSTDIRSNKGRADTLNE